MDDSNVANYYSLTGYRLRLWMRLYFIIGALLPEGFKADCKLKGPNDDDVVLTRTITLDQYKRENP